MLCRHRGIDARIIKLRKIEQPVIRFIVRAWFSPNHGRSELLKTRCVHSAHGVNDGMSIVLPYQDSSRRLSISVRRAVATCPPAASRQLAAVLSAGNDKEGPKSLGKHGPKLLPRPVKPQLSGGGRGGGDGPRGGPERSLASLAAYSGLVGTMAIVLANAFGIDLWGSFDFSSQRDLQLAAIVSIPLQLANCALMLPSFSSPRLPELANLETMEANLQREQHQREEALRSQLTRAPSPTTSSTPIPTSSSPIPATSSTPIPTSTAPTSHTQHQASASSAAAAPRAPCLAQASGATPPLAAAEASSPLHDKAPVAEPGLEARTAAATATATWKPLSVEAQTQSRALEVKTGSWEATSKGAEAPSAGLETQPRVPEAPSRGSDAPSAQRPPVGALPASSWGTDSGGNSNEGRKAGGVDWTGIRAALHLAQGYYISNNPTARLTVGVEAAYSVVDTAAGEMLYRGVALTWLASWLQDRVYEAGLDEAISEQLPAVVAAALGSAEAQRLASTIGVYGTCAYAVSAATAMFVVWSVMSRSRRSAQRLEALMRLGSEAASNRGPAATNGGGGVGPGKEGGSPRGPTQVMFGPGAPSVDVSNAGAMMSRAASVQAARDAAQVLLLNGLFIATGGNLAASFSAALVNQLIFNALQRQGVRRMKERSAALAKELRAYNAQMQRIAAKYKDLLPRAAAERLDAMNEIDAQEAENAVARTDGSSSSGSSIRVTSSGMSGSSTSSGGRDGAAGEHITSGASTNQNYDEAESASTPAASAATAADVSSRSSGRSNSSNRGFDGARSSSSLENALAMLDQLVPEPQKPASSGKQLKQ